MTIYGDMAPRRLFAPINKQGLGPYAIAQKSLPQQNCAAGFYIKYGVALFAHFFADAFLAKDAEGDGSGKEDGRERAEYHTEYHGEGK